MEVLQQKVERDHYTNGLSKNVRNKNASNRNVDNRNVDNRNNTDISVNNSGCFNWLVNFIFGDI